MITIHCGLHKTGSSSIQVALSLIPRRGGIAVRVPIENDQLSKDHLSQRLRVLVKSPEAVLSDENLLGSPLDGYEMAAERMHVLREVLSGRKYQMVVYLRPQPDWLASLYLQGVQEGSGTRPEPFWSQIKDFPLLRWSRLVQLLEAESGAERVHVRAFIPGRDVVTDFFRTAGLGAPPVSGRVALEENVSIRAIQAPLLSLLNSRRGDDALDRARLRTVFQGLLRLEASAGMSPFPEDLQRTMAAAFLDDWALLTERQENKNGEDGPAFRAALRSWRDEPLPYAGASLNDPQVQEEAIRSLLVLALDRRNPYKGPVQRLAAVMRERPRDLPSLALSRLGRYF